MVADTVQAWGSTLLLTSCVVTARALISLWSGRRGLSDWVVRTMQSRQSMQLWPSADQVLRTWQAVNVCGGVNKKWSLTVLLWLWGGGENVCLCVCFLQLIFLKFWFDVCFPIFDFFLFLCTWMFCLQICLRTPCEYSAQEGQRGHQISLKLELQPDESYHVSTGNWTPGPLQEQQSLQPYLFSREREKGCEVGWIMKVWDEFAWGKTMIKNI